MAKRKTPKVKDLRPEKITDEQLKKVQDVVNNLNRSQMDIGQIESRKHEILQIDDKFFLSATVINAVLII